MKARNFYMPINEDETYIRDGWLDHVCDVNPQGAMACLSNAGYSGFLAPQDLDELRDALIVYIESNGEQAVMEIMKCMPEYEVIIFNRLPNYSNATGEETGETENLVDKIVEQFKQMDKTLKVLLGITILLLILKD